MSFGQGVNFFDTADMYEGYDRKPGTPGGVAELILGKALHDRRDRAVITTKVGSVIGGSAYEGSGLGRAHILHQIDASLGRLQTDYVDFYELHRDDPETSLEEPLAVMADLIGAGKVRYWGFSNFEAHRVEEMLGICKKNAYPLPVIAQPPYSWLERSIETDYLPLCRRHQISVTPYQPLQSGLLTGKYRRNQPPPPGSRALERPAWIDIYPQVFDKLDVFEREAHSAGVSPTQYALHWLFMQPGVSAVVVGAKRQEQLEELIGGCD